MSREGPVPGGGSGRGRAEEGAPRGGRGRRRHGREQLGAGVGMPCRERGGERDEDASKEGRGHRGGGEEAHDTARLGASSPWRAAAREVTAWRVSRG